MNRNILLYNLKIYRRKQRRAPAAGRRGSIATFSCSRVIVMVIVTVGGIKNPNSGIFIFPSNNKVFNKEILNRVLLEIVGAIIGRRRKQRTSKENGGQEKGIK